MARMAQDELEWRARRDQLAADSPVDFDMAANAYGCTPDLTKQSERAAFFAVWSMLQYEFADAMLAAAEG